MTSVCAFSYRFFLATLTYLQYHRSDGKTKTARCNVTAVLNTLQGDWNVEVDKDACGNWRSICGPFCNNDTNERGLILLEFATFNDLVFASTFGHHKSSRRWTWHSPNGQHHSQIDYSPVRKRFHLPEHDIFPEQTLEVTTTC